MDENEDLLKSNFYVTSPIIYSNANNQSLMLNESRILVVPIFTSVSTNPNQNGTATVTVNCSPTNKMEISTLKVGGLAKNGLDGQTNFTEPVISAVSTSLYPIGVDQIFSSSPVKTSVNSIAELLTNKSLIFPTSHDNGDLFNQNVFCKWNNCHEVFLNQKELRLHFINAHMDSIQKQQLVCFY